MPLYVGSTSVVSPPPPPLVSADPPVGSIRATWTDPDGNVFELSGPHEQHGWLTRPQIGGWGAAPITLVTDPVANGGERIRHQRSEPRRLTWPLNIHGENTAGEVTHERFLSRYRTLMRAFTLTKYKGAGLLTVDRPSGERRCIEAFYEDGFGGEPGENWIFANPTLTLFCPDGYWRDTEARTVRREHVTGGGSPYLDPFPTVSESRVLGATAIDYDGEVPSWPSWRFTGPGTKFTARNDTTGRGFTITHTLLAGEQITVEVTPDRAMVRGPAGQNLADKVDFPGAEFWALLPGRNDVTFTIDNAADGSAVELSYFRRHEAA